MGEGSCVSSSEIINMLLACSEPVSSGEKMTLKSLSLQNNVVLDIFYSITPLTWRPLGPVGSPITRLVASYLGPPTSQRHPYPFLKALLSPSVLTCSFLNAFSLHTCPMTPPKAHLARTPFCPGSVLCPWGDPTGRKVSDSRGSSPLPIPSFWIYSVKSEGVFLVMSPDRGDKRSGR